MTLSRSKADYPLSVRIPQELLHKIEAKVAWINQARAEARAAGRMSPGDHGPTSVSECVRHAIEVAFKVWEQDEDFKWDWCSDFIEKEVKALLARAVIDAEERKKLVRKLEPDFG